MTPEGYEPEPEQLRLPFYAPHPPLFLIRLIKQGLKNAEFQRKLDKVAEESDGIAQMVNRLGMWDE